MDNSDSYRIAMKVTETVIFKKVNLVFSICPRCNKSLDREYMEFCSNCGQKLSWKDFNKTKITYK